jgi:hypothetical protein
MMGPVWDPGFVLLLGKGYARFFRKYAGRGYCQVVRGHTTSNSAFPLSLLLSPVLDKDEVHYRVPGIVNTDEEEQQRRR